MSSLFGSLFGGFRQFDDFGSDQALIYIFRVSRNWFDGFRIGTAFARYEVGEERAYGVCAHQCTGYLP